MFHTAIGLLGMGQEAELDEQEVYVKLVFLISAYREPDKDGTVEHSHEFFSSWLGSAVQTPTVTPNKEEICQIEKEKRNRNVP